MFDPRTAALLRSARWFTPDDDAIVATNALEIQFFFVAPDAVLHPFNGFH